MSYKSKVTDVAVRDQVLWIGREAYPVQNIARARTAELKPNRAAAVRRYLSAVVFWVLLGIGAAVADAQGLTGLGAAIIVLLVVLMIISTIRLIRMLSMRTFYALVIETAGTPHTALVSTDEGTLRELVGKIMEATRNPAITFHQAIQNFDLHGAQGVQIGDRTKQNNTFTAR
jgi:Family of unknown function (DUF6232)